MDEVPPVNPPSQASPQGEHIDEILTLQEKAGDGLRDIRCMVRFAEEDRINLSRRTKIGSVLLLLTKPNPLFLVHFERSEVDGIVGKQEWYLFDGHWLHQAVERLRQVTKQEVADEGHPLDLFDLETAPFPLPFGQKKQKILDNFDVTLVPPGAGDPPDTDHLVCIPKSSGKLYDKYDKLEFFVRRDLHLPNRAIVVKKGGSEINTADFPDLSSKSINTGVTKKDFARPPAWKDYKEVVEKLTD